MFYTDTTPIEETSPTWERVYQWDVNEWFLDIVGRIGMLKVAAFGSAMLAANDD